VAEIEFTEEQQALVDKLIGDARVKAREKAQADQSTTLAKEKDTAEKAALAASQKWQELAEMHQARVAELEPFEAQAKAYGELIAGMLKDRLKELGSEATKAVGSLPDAMTMIEKLAWLNQNAGLFQAAGDGVGTPGARRPAKNKKTAGDVGHRRLRM